MPGTYLNGFFESLPLPYAEAGYGYPEQGQSIVNATNGKLMRLLVDDEPFDVRYGTLSRHERVLDLRAGVLRRTVEWTSPAGQAVRVRSTRLVSFVQRSIAAVSYEVEADRHVGAGCRPVRARRQRAGSGPSRRRSPRGGGAARPAGRRVPQHARPGGCARAPHPPERPAHGGRPRPRRRRAGGDGHRRRKRTGPGARHGQHRAHAGPGRCA